MEVRVLGQFEVVVDGAPIDLSAQRPRAALAALVLRAGRPTSVDALTEAVWNGNAPASARKRPAPVHHADPACSSTRPPRDEPAGLPARARGRRARRDPLRAAAGRRETGAHGEQHPARTRALRSRDRPVAGGCAGRPRLAPVRARRGVASRRPAARVHRGTGRRRSPARPARPGADRARAARSGAPTARTPARPPDDRPVPSRSAGRRSCLLPRRQGAAGRRAGARAVRRAS